MVSNNNTNGNFMIIQSLITYQKNASAQLCLLRRPEAQKLQYYAERFNVQS